MKKGAVSSDAFVSERWLNFSGNTVSADRTGTADACTTDETFPDTLSKLYRLQDQSFWYCSRNRLIAQLAKCYFHNARTVIEIGCGTGYVLLALRAALPSSRLLGSDVCARALNYAAKRVAPSVELLRWDPLSLPSKAQFDLICAFDVLEHVDDDESFLREMHRALRPNGGILMSVPQHRFLWSKSDLIKNHKRRYRSRELDDLCRRSGFEIVASTSFVTILFPLMLLQRLTRARRRAYDPISEHTLPGWCGRLFETALDAEVRAIGFGLSLPFGGSRFVVARAA